MFTGLVETIGREFMIFFTPNLLITNRIAQGVSKLTTLDSSTSRGGGTSLTISNCAKILSDASLGDRISVDGTCLTISEFDHSALKVGVASETLRRTNLVSL
jgi:riboflavin synthase